MFVPVRHGWVQVVRRNVRLCPLLLGSFWRAVFLWLTFKRGWMRYVPVAWREVAFGQVASGLVRSGVVRFCAVRHGLVFFVEV